MRPVVLSAQELYTLSRKYLKYFPSFNASDRGLPAVTSHTLDQPSLFLNCRRGVLDVIAHMLHLQRGWQDVVSKESKHTTSLPRLSFWCVSELVDKERSMFVSTKFWKRGRIRAHLLAFCFLPVNISSPLIQIRKSAIAPVCMCKRASVQACVSSSPACAQSTSQAR